MSITQGAKEVGVAGSHLANILLALDPDFRLAKSGPALLDRAQLGRAQEALKATMRSSEAKILLGMDRSIMKLALERRIITCLIPPSPGHFGLMWRHDIVRISRLFASFSEVPVVGLLSPAVLAGAGGVATAEIFIGVVEGKLKPDGRRDDITGFDGLLFNPAAADSVQALLRGEMHRRRLAVSLGWMPGTISELQRRKLLQAEGFEAVRMDDLASFRSQYASAEEARNWLKNSPPGAGPMHSLLREHCGPPVVGGPGVTAFWPRLSTAAKLRSLMRAGADISAIGVGS